METAFLITFSVFFTLLFFLVGGIIGWVYRENTLNTFAGFNDMHPEMFDQHGNLLPDEILALRIEHTNDEDYDEED